MKKLNTLVLLVLALLSFQQVDAQDPFLDEMYDITVTNDITYGVNATALFLSVVGEAVPEELKMDVYEPVGDDNDARPLVIYLHTGNFLPQPQFCSIGGNRDDDTVVEIAERLAKRGYVVAVVDYRLGWNPAASSQQDRTFGLINAAYRGVQDARTAVRYFKKEAAENSNPFKVDTDKITYFGQGTGGYISLAAATIDNYLDIVLPKFTVDFMGQPVPMVIESINGDIFGTSYGVVTAPFDAALPFPLGDTLCYPNHVGYDSDVQLAVNLGGAMGDISWLDESDPPFISFHVPNDSLAPYEEFTLTVPTTCDLIVEVQGSYLVQQKANDLGLNDVFDVENFRQDFRTYTDRADMVNDGYDGLFPFVYPSFDQPTQCFEELTVTAPWEFWDAADFENVFCDLQPTVNMHQVGLAGNPLMTEDQGMAYIDTIIGYFAPRAYLALELGDASIVSTEDLAPASEVKLTLTPNPASQQVIFNTASDQPMENIRLFDINGRLVSSHMNINANDFTLYRQNLSSGIYIAKVTVEAGVISRKVVFE